MGLFSFGRSKSKTKSDSFSTSFDNLDAFGFNFGFNQSFSDSISRGSSFSRGASTSRVFAEDVFRDLFGGASRAAGGIDTGSIAGAANMLFSGGTDVLNALQQGGEGADFLRNRLSSDGLVDEQIGLLGDDLARFLAEDVNPAITSGGVSASTLGGSRGEVQKGIATGKAADAFTRGAVSLRVADQSQRDQIAAGLMQSDASRNQASLAALPMLFGLAESGAMAGLSPFAALASIIGDPTVLTDSISEGGSEQFSRALAEALGIDLGMNSTTGRAGSTSTSRTRSSSSSGSIGIGS